MALGLASLLWLAALSFGTGLQLHENAQVQELASE